MEQIADMNFMPPFPPVEIVNILNDQINYIENPIINTESDMVPIEVINHQVEYNIELEDEPEDEPVLMRSRPFTSGEFLYVDDVRESRKEMMHLMMKEVALKNVMEGLSGGVKLRPLDKINISLRYLEKTEGEFNPSTKLAIENKTLVLNMGSEEMEQRIMELAAQLKINNLQQYATDHPSAILANPIEEST